ncbi:MFS transporter [Kibdelosporangium persicum]|uniref:Arabinose efflux permease n=1 Tax=Kibdelosporangium persicum TaxID=2698649 RepID=A0ABX2FHA2_9PSEU|nr:MFS transporter [Kibdelosporangium persicum]NRN70779.1 Arabinose efflux permease [Kibdelosporangium persicum]
MTTATVRVPSAWLALLAGPMSFGIAGSALVLPQAAAALDVSVASATMIVVAFGWGIAVGTPLLAGLLSHKGTRGTLLVCGLLVAAGTLLAVTVPTLLVLVVGSALQALGTAGLTVVAMHLAGSAATMGLITATLASVGAVAPLAGALVADELSWRAVFALPALSLLAIPVIAARAQPVDSDSDRPFDTVGAILVVALVTACTAVPHQPLPASAVVVGAVLLLGMHLRRRPSGFLPAILVRTGQFRTSAALSFALAVVNFGILYAAPRLLADRSVWTTGEVGTVMVVPYLVGGLGSWVLATAAAKVAPRLVPGCLAGAGLLAVCLVVLGTPIPLLIIAMALGSLAAATGQAVLTVRATDAVPSRYRAATVGLINLCYLLGVAFGPAIAALTG